MLQSAFLYHVYSGQLFFTAALLFIIGIAGGRRLRILPLLAIPLAALSGTPMPLWVAIPLVAVTGIAAFTNEEWRRGLPALAKIVAIAAVVLAAALEAPYHLGDSKVARPRRLIVIGDSLASGLGETNPWPRRLGPGVANLSMPSDTATSALQSQLPRLPDPIPGDLVIIELGGNDMLDGTPPEQFEAALHQIVRACAPRTVVMLEVPVLPGKWSYGAAQRRVSRRHDVVFVPKRVLALVLGDTRNTDDGLHLTDRGHEQLTGALRTSLGW